MVSAALRLMALHTFWLTGSGEKHFTIVTKRHEKDRHAALGVLVGAGIETRGG